MMTSKVRGWLVALGGVAFSMNEGMGAGAAPVVAEASSGREFVLALGLGVLLLIATVFRRRRRS